jgi:hypothetical protein
MKCILRSKGLQLLAKVHCGECGCHIASAHLVSKAYKSSFYWPTAMVSLVKRCKGCQFFGKQQHLPAQVLRTIPPYWPFATWGLDYVSPFRTAPGGYKYILVAVDKSPSGLRFDLSQNSHRKNQQSSYKTLHISSACLTESSPT